MEEEKGKSNLLILIFTKYPKITLIFIATMLIAISVLVYFLLQSPICSIDAWGLKIGFKEDKKQEINNEQEKSIKSIEDMTDSLMSNVYYPKLLEVLIEKQKNPNDATNDVLNQKYTGIVLQLVDIKYVKVPQYRKELKKGLFMEASKSKTYEYLKSLNDKNK